QLFEQADDTFWVATTNGIVEFVEEATHAHAGYRWYNMRHGLSYPEITAVNEDLAGNFWMGTKEGGVMKLSRNGFATFAESDDVRAAASLAEDSHGDLCVRGTPTEYFLDQDPNFPTPFASFDGVRFTWFAPATLGRAPDVGWVCSERSSDH